MTPTSLIGAISQRNKQFYACGRSRNQRWIATPLKNYADVDALTSARQSVMDAGGRKLKKALVDFYDAMTEQNDAIRAMMDEDSDYQALFARFTAISTGSETMHTMYNPEASINPEAPESRQE